MKTKHKRVLMRTIAIAMVLLFILATTFGNLIAFFAAVATVGIPIYVLIKKDEADSKKKKSKKSSKGRYYYY